MAFYNSYRHRGAILALLCFLFPLSAGAVPDWYRHRPKDGLFVYGAGRGATASSAYIDAAGQIASHIFITVEVDYSESSTYDRTDITDKIVMRVAQRFRGTDIADFEAANGEYFYLLKLPKTELRAVYDEYQRRHLAAIENANTALAASASATQPENIFSLIDALNQLEDFSFDPAFERVKSSLYRELAAIPIHPTLSGNCLTVAGPWLFTIGHRVFRECVRLTDSELLNGIVRMDTPQFALQITNAAIRSSVSEILSSHSIRMAELSASCVDVTGPLAVEVGRILVQHGYCVRRGGQFTLHTSWNESPAESKFYRFKLTKYAYELKLTSGKQLLGAETGDGFVPAGLSAVSQLQDQFEAKITHLFDLPNRVAMR